MKEYILLLWSSGWDSTYRLVELSRKEDIIVQPIYITGMGRKSESREIVAQEEILEVLSQKSETKAEIRPVKYVDVRIIPQDEKVNEAYKKIRETVALGIQYDILSQYAATLSQPIEIGSEGGEEGTMRMNEAISMCGGLVKEGDTYILNPEHATETGKLAFGNFLFPIIDKSEGYMLKKIKEWGYEDVMSRIWFCHTPIDGTQCGVCRACEVKMLNHMEFLLPKEAQKRFKVKLFFWKIFGIRIANGICRRIWQR